MGARYWRRRWRARSVIIRVRMLVADLDGVAVYLAFLGVYRFPSTTDGIILNFADGSKT